MHGHSYIPTSTFRRSRTMASGDVSIRPYSEGDMWVLERTLGEPSQMVYLNGRESPEKIRDRHRKYVALSEDPRTGCMFTIMSGSDVVGNVGYWESGWDGEEAWETGWFVLPELQGRGIATAATRLIVQRVAGLRKYRYLYAFPSVDNRPSNAICRKLGFDLVGETSSEYPPKSGLTLRVNIWRLDLQVAVGQPVSKSSSPD